VLKERSPRICADAINTYIHSMGKNLKQREETPNINTTANKDIIQRLNFLYQASVYLQSLDVGLPRETPALNESAHKRKYPRTKRKTRKRTTGDLSREYIQCMRQVAQKTTVKMCVKYSTSRMKFERPTVIRH